MIATLGESLKLSAHGDTPGHISSFFCKTFDPLGNS